MELRPLPDQKKNGSRLSANARLRRKMLVEDGAPRLFRSVRCGPCALLNRQSNIDGVRRNYMLRDSIDNHC
jgi:hypothetical protein